MMTKASMRSSLIAMSLLITACSPTSETDPSKVSWYDLWFGQDRLEGHLEAKRQELAGLETQSAALEKRLADKQGQLQILEATLREEKRNERTVDRERAAVLNEVESKTAELQQVSGETRRLKTELASLEATLASSSEEKQTIEDKIDLYHVELEDLEAETVVLERAIDRLLAVKAKHALETE